MKRENEYMFKSRVRFSESDHHQQITLPGIINYFQDCSTFQSEALGVGVEACMERGRGWVLSSWQVEVDRYPKFGETVAVRTWACGFQGLYGYRNFCLEDEEGRMAAYAFSVWVYMDMKKGRPIKVDEEEVKRYGYGDPLAMDYASRKIALPKETKAGTPFPVRRYHIDTNEHVNNCQYVQMAQEILPDPEGIFKMRAEYKKSAVYGDMIYPEYAKEEDREVASLCDEAGKPYALVEFKRR